MREGNKKETAAFWIVPLLIHVTQMSFLPLNPVYTKPKHYLFMCRLESGLMLEVSLYNFGNGSRKTHKQACDGHWKCPPYVSNASSW